MFYSQEDINKKFDAVAKFFAVEDFVIPMPQHCHGPNWTDELREKNGWQKFDDGSWGRAETSMAVYNSTKKDVEELYKQYQELCSTVTTLRKKNYELEYGCRVAAKALEKVSKLSGESE